MRPWMIATTFIATTGIATTGIVLVAVPARAQLMDSLRGAAGSGSGGAGGLGSGLGGGLGGMSTPSVGSASTGNIAGVLQYCVRNNYLGGTGASSVESGLVGKLGPGATRSSQYSAGDQGTLQTGNGQSMSLGGGGLKAKLTQKVCAQVLQHARSLM